MKLFSALCILACTVSLSANAQTRYTNFTTTNPFYSESKLPFHAPDFTKIKNSDFKPALEEGIRMHEEEIEKIANNPASPTFENTLAAMEKSGSLLERVSSVFSLLTSANTNPELQQLRQWFAPLEASHRDAIYLNTKLFKRVETLYNNRNKLKLDAESKRLIEVSYQRFVLAGAKLPETEKTNLKKLNERQASLSAKFGNQLLGGTKAGALVIDDKTELAGLSEGDINGAARDAKTRKLNDKWILLLQNTTQQPALQSLSNRSVRQKLFETSWSRTEKNDSNDTRNTIIELVKVRIEKAKLLGFSNFAEWKLIDQMAKTPQAVQDFLNKLVPAATAKAKSEAAEIQQMIDKQNGGFKLAPWDWNYYAEQVRKEKYDLDENETKPYFELDNVLQKGVFYAANQLYGLTFKERKDIPVWQEDVRVFEVHDKDNSVLGLFYCDYFKRDNKNGGAWNSRLVGPSKFLNTRPVIYNVCNFSKPAAGQPALLTFDNVRTIFHEFGHALHNFLSNVKYPSIAGSAVARDYAEFPSQFNEHWALDSKVLKNYAFHYQTKQPIPQALIDKIKKADTFDGGYGLTELLAACLLDMQWHSLSDANAVTDVDDFEKEALKKSGVDLYEVPPRYRSSYFSHIFSGGYAAGYYGYLWTDMLDEDAYSWFKENGGLTRANGQRFRDMILSKGNTEDYGKMFRAFRGHDPDIKPMQQSRGLIPK